jgi:hypothetical protein
MEKKDTFVILKQKAQTAALSTKSRLRKGNSKGMKSGNGDLPPEIRNNAIVRQTIRFSNTAAVSGSNGNITNTDIFGAIGVCGKVVNTSAVAVASSFKIRAIDIYPAGGSGASNVALTWTDSANDLSPDTEFLNAMPASITGLSSKFHAVPPKGSIASFWHNKTASAGDVLLNVFLTATGCILDLHVDWTTETMLSTVQTINCGTLAVGNFVRLCLNKSSTANTIVPMDYPTTT